MENFINYPGSWFYEKYHDKPGRRFWSFWVSLNLFLQVGGTNIVETGCLRQKDDWGGGMSTFIFGEFCEMFGKHLWTVDNSGEAMTVCKEVTRPFADFISYRLGDSVRFLKKFKERIDFLYLDSMDCAIAPEADNTLSQLHQLKELKAALSLTYPPKIILLDDNDFENGGKTRLSKKFLRENNWTCLLDFRHSLWVRIPFARPMGGGKSES